MSNQIITLGGGCFWCLEAVFDQVHGVVDVESGYCNGQVAAPTYEQVCTGETGVAEVVRVEFDPSQISLKEVLDIFFSIHDPTSLNRQGNDQGTQYRSGIYFELAEHEAICKTALAEQARTWGKPIVTELVPLALYSTAEDYHQNYFEQHPNAGYCAFVVAPKVLKFRKKFDGRVKPNYR